MQPSNTTNIFTPSPNTFIAETLLKLFTNFLPAIEALTKNRPLGIMIKNNTLTINHSMPDWVLLQAVYNRFMDADMDILEYTLNTKEHEEESVTIITIIDLA